MFRKGKANTPSMKGKKTARGKSKIHKEFDAIENSDPFPGQKVPLCLED